MESEQTQDAIARLGRTKEWLQLAEGMSVAKNTMAGFEKYVELILSTGNFSKQFKESQQIIINAYSTRLRTCYGELSVIQKSLIEQHWFSSTMAAALADRHLLTIKDLGKTLGEYHVFYKLNYTLARRH
ncbi:uncharacterized protein HMPREF1541_04198 [Cyphellophora europaea CBS 101466]|uniref:Uncharacterized protein n=1 Tax=Cyphellophora europaea (strain CBS 101466) TaxID=1220924 RepID=W2S0Q3_CYPE1|nr:uncharacterized protein HMPREF1541_04198 [Cyphellophora europaea CBS 101466]ETN42257.1 hypothetical protein HMPREF1541_04198 [Cyphellophora europaea CBS 101466]